MQRLTLQKTHMQTMSWYNNALVDWACAGRLYSKNGEVKDIGRYNFGYNFDSSVISECGQYAVIYQKLGTKGLLLKDGEILREINRSYYQADVYEYPVAFVKAKNGTTYLIHCPQEYCRIDFEDVETGEIISNHPERKPSDFFHSRFEVSPDNSSFLSKGWAWHPFDFIELFDVEACIRDPRQIDKGSIVPDVNDEICTASYINNDLVLIASTNGDEISGLEISDKLQKGQLAIWNIRTKELSGIVKAKFRIGGNLIAIDDTLAWELYDYPKIINYRTGELVEKLEEIATGQQLSSLLFESDNLPLIAFNKHTKELAIQNGDKVEILAMSKIV